MIVNRNHYFKSNLLILFNYQFIFSLFVEPNAIEIACRFWKYQYPQLQHAITTIIYIMPQNIQCGIIKSFNRIFINFYFIGFSLSIK